MKTFFLPSLRAGVFAVLTGFALVACSEGPTDPPVMDPDPNPTDTLSTPPLRIVGVEGAIRFGEVVRFSVERGEGVDGNVTWVLEPAEAGKLDQTGRFVPYQGGFGPSKVIARVQSFADTFDVVVQSRGSLVDITVVGRSEVPLRGTTDLWVHGTVAYTGTRSRFFMNTTRRGEALHTWDVSDPSNPVLTSTLLVDAGTVNDIKVNAAGTVGVLTHEGSRDRLNGITILDLSDPLQPSVITRFTQGLENGVHNVWLEGDYAYVAGGPLGLGLRLLIVDISDPANPFAVSDYFAGSSLIHDVYVREGLAFVSHWDAGLVILDVGNGIAGGSPENPVEVSRIQLGGNTHNAWYWPATGYVFVGEEDFNKPGILHVVDASDLANPVEVASYAVAGSPPHNFWVDEERGMLYVGWYQTGLQGIDVSGELWGELGLGGRVMIRSLYNNGRGCGSFAPDCTFTWAPQLHNGLIYVSDLGSGLWVLRPEF
jgi:LVIVD repeat